MPITGTWGPVNPWPIVAINATLTPDGKVFSHGTDLHGQQGSTVYYDIWDPITGVHQVLNHGTHTDIFCSANVIIPDTGEILIAGGDSRGTGGPINFGVPDTNIYNWQTDTITPSPTGPMNHARWYPTVVTLGNGQILITGGVDANGKGVGTSEIYTQGVGWQELPGTFTQATADHWFYPRAWLSSNGKIYMFPAWNDTANGPVFAINPNGNGAVAQVGQTPFANSNQLPSVMYEQDKILTLDKNGTAWIMDISGPVPTFHQTAPVGATRFWSNLVVLADGSVMASGGSNVENHLEGVTYDVKIWHPETGQWTQGPNEAIARLYHSTTLLLPDATVISFGGGAPGPLTNLNSEIFTPGYLLNGDGTPAARPVITEGPTRVAPFSKFTITVDDAAQIDHLTLVKFGNVTHSLNMDQRKIDVAYNHGAGDQLIVDLPDNSNVVTPGYWMLFAINKAGVPSIAQTLHISNGPNIVEPPQYPRTVPLPQNLGDIFVANPVDDWVGFSGASHYDADHQAVTVTPQAEGTKGVTAFKQRIDFNHDFVLQAQLNFSNSTAAGDGMAVVLHNDARGLIALGGGGGELGAQGISNSVGIAFDIYKNDGVYGDTYANNTHFFDPQRDVANRRLSGDVDAGAIDDGQWHVVQVLWDAETQTLRYVMDGKQMGSLQRNLTADQFGGSDYAYLAITGATGGSVSHQQFRINSLQAVFEPLPNGGDNQLDPRCIFDVKYTKDRVTYTGDALYDVGADTFLLTPDNKGTTGGITLSKRIDVSHDFTVVFEINAGGKAGGADGLSLFLHNDPRGAEATAGGGGNLGAMGLENGVGISFDTWKNGGAYNDAFENSSSIFRTEGPIDGNKLAPQTELGNLTDAAWHTVGLAWDAERQTLTYWIDGKQAGVLTNDIAKNFLGSEHAYLGFAAATGGESNLQQLKINAIDAVFEGELALHNCKKDLSDISKMVTVSGNAGYDGPSDTFHITPDAVGQVGGVMFNERIALGHDFAVSFDILMGAKANGGDGMSFVLHNDPRGAAALGYGGGNLGATGISNGLAIEFDTYQNGAPFFDMANDHTGFLSTAGMTTMAGHGGMLTIDNPLDLGTITDGAWHNVLVVWNAENQSLNYFFDGRKGGEMKGDFAHEFLGGSEYAYFGFTGATGASTNVLDLHINSLSALFEGEDHDGLGHNTLPATGITANDHHT